MDWKCEEVRDRSLRAAASSREFELHMAALEWSLIDPIIINSEDDIKATNWRDLGLRPFTHQIQNLITFCRRLPVTLIADDVGLGKTISAGLILSELISRKRVNRTLVICPKVLTQQWVGELDQKFGITAKEATGADLDVELERNTPVVVTTYHSASSRLERLSPGQFDLCILDEAHKLRNLHGAQNTPAMAENVRAALERRPFKYVVMLTATPIQNRVWDLYSLIDLLKVAEGKPNPLGSPQEFKTRFVQPGSDGRNLKLEQAKTFQNLVRPCLSRTRRTDVALTFPERRLSMVRVPLTGSETAMQIHIGRIIGSLNALSQTSLAQAFMSSPRALVKQAENMAGLDSDAVRQLRDLAARIPMPAKLARLLALLEELRTQQGQTWRAVVFTVRRETQDMIGEALRARGITVGFIRGADATGNRKTIAGYNADLPTVHAIVSTDAGAEGINLQKGNVLINYDLPWNPMVVEQRIGRVQRLGSDFENVVILNLVGAGTIEDRIVARLLDKLQGVSQALGNIEGILEAAGLDEESGASFESRMRKMVVEALQGKDVAVSQRLFEADVDRAGKIFEEQREYLNRTLGQSREDPTSHRPLPKIERSPPRIAYRDFVFGAKRAEGWTVREIDALRAEATAPGRVMDRISFYDGNAAESSRAIFAESLARCYLPGKPAFERLVQHWIDHHAHNIADTKPMSVPSAVELAKAWCRSNPGCEFIAAKYTPNEAAFQGTVHIKVTAGTGVDKFEKLIQATIAPPTRHGPVTVAKTTEALTSDVAIGKILPQFDSTVKEVVEADAEVKVFCEYYLGRLREGRAEPYRDQYHLSKMESDFRPYVQADVVAIHGVSYDTGTVRVRFKADGVEYQSDLVAIPATGQLLDGVARGRCAITGADWPIACLVECTIKKQLALRHRLKLTAKGVRVMPVLTATCAVSGELHLLSDMAPSAVSGQIALRSKMVSCAVTGDLVFWRETGVSDFSDRMVRDDLLMPSEKNPHRRGVASEFGLCDVTKKRLLNDELAKSEASGRSVDCDLLKPLGRIGRLALESELMKCEQSGVELLFDETGLCSVSGKRVDRDLLRPSTVSGKLAVGSLLVECGVTGKFALPSELETCAVTGIKAIPSELGVCSVTGQQSLRTELARCEHSLAILLGSLLGVSDFSGKTVARTYLIPSDKAPCRQGLQDEFGICALTQRSLLLDELARSSVSNALVDRDLLICSKKSGRLALPSEIVACGESGGELLLDETGLCSVSGKRVDRDLLRPSTVSGKLAVGSLLVECGVTRKFALPSELETCAVTGIKAISRQFGSCASTGTRVLLSELSRCGKSHESILKSLLGRSDFSGISAAKISLIQSEKAPHRSGLLEETGRCVESKRVLLKDELGRSDVSGKVVDLSLLVNSEVSTSRALRNEMEVCQLTGKRVLPGELERCSITSRRVLRGEMVRSTFSGRWAIGEHAVRMPNRNWALTDETTKCVWLNETILRSDAGRCNLTGVIVSKSYLNGDGQLIPLVKLLDSPFTVRVDSSLMRSLRGLDPDLAGLQDATVSHSPGVVQAICCEVVQRSWLRKKVEYYGLLIRVSPGHIEVVGYGVRGYRDEDSQFIIEDRELEFG